MRISGRKDVIEAVLIAALTAIATGIWGIIEEEIKEHRKKKNGTKTKAKPKKIAK